MVKSMFSGPVFPHLYRLLLILFLTSCSAQIRKIPLGDVPSPLLVTAGKWSAPLSVSPRIHWNAPIIPETMGFSRFEIAVGSTAGGTDLSSWQTVGPSVYATASGLSLRDGGSYYVSVRTIDSLGRASAPASSPRWIAGLTPSFIARTDLAAAVNPRDVQVTDLNGDGFLDLVSVTANALLSVHLGNGDGTFQTRQDYTAVVPQNLALADFNGDGKTDAVVSNYYVPGAATFSIFLGNADGTFQAKVDYPGGYNMAAVAVGDVNEDGSPDVVANDDSNALFSVFLNNGNGTFPAGVNYTTSPHPKSIILVDLNRDGHLDAVTANEGASSDGTTVSVLLGNGDGTFRAKNDFTTGTMPRCVFASDLNGDGIPDLAVTNYMSATVSILIGNGDGTFRPKVDYAVGTSPIDVKVRDMNGDGVRDLVVANTGSGVISILLGHGDGTFSPRADLTSATNPYRIQFGDFNRDGIIDLVAPNRGSSSLGIYLGK